MAPAEHLPNPHVGPRDGGAASPPQAWHLRCSCGAALLSSCELDAMEFCRHAKASGHKVVIQLYVPATRIGSGVAQWNVWTRAVSEPGVVVVHRLFEGWMLCELFSGMPRTWPEGHKWSSTLAEVTCVRCREKP